jgi:hypothetical protein
VSETRTVGITYREPGEVDYDLEYFDHDSGGYCAEDACGRTRVITVEEPIDSTLGSALTRLILRDLDGSAYWTPSHRILVTTEGWWSGYSEYTVTSTWETVVVTCPERNWERRWETPAALFADLAASEADGGR